MVKQLAHINTIDRSNLFYFYAMHGALGCVQLDRSNIVRIDRIQPAGQEDSDEESSYSSLSDYINDIRWDYVHFVSDSITDKLIDIKLCDYSLYCHLQLLLKSLCTWCLCRVCDKLGNTEHLCSSEILSSELRVHRMTSDSDNAPENWRSEILFHLICLFVAVIFEVFFLPKVIFSFILRGLNWEQLLAVNKRGYVVQGKTSREHMKSLFAKRITKKRLEIMFFTAHS